MTRPSQTGSPTTRRCGSLGASVRSADGGGGGAFAGSFVNTLIYIVVGGVGTFVLAFLFAMVLREMRASKLIRAILFFPNIVAPLALGMYFGFVFRAPDGLANNMLGAFGIDNLKFLSSDNVTYVAMAGIVWSSAGFYITIIMAAIDRVPTYLYEDAAIAGASAWQKFRSITLPAHLGRRRHRRRAVDHLRGQDLRAGVGARGPRHLLAAGARPGRSASWSSTARSAAAAPRSTARRVPSPW